ncbi:DUF624 domain-containing protein [Halobacillus litoralis]|uniref:DUF624 domain-containing protein n=1 Tax=Halobacillus litoralis TaxID=45668 RepID=UPI001CD7C4AB|nr:DUF624 domain-containing protein [Halobacillus litoralis]MCA1022072.1 DUF624 domain-containing protein [Halobacillus litoralis]
MKGTGAVIYQCCDWLMRLAVLNILWLTFSMAGLLVFGVFPASAAASALLKEWVAGERPASFSYFRSIYRQSFFSSNTVFTGGSLVFILLGLNLYTSLQFQGILFYLFVSGTIFLMSGLFLLLMLTLLPLGSGEKTMPSLRHAFHLLMCYPGRLVSLSAGIVLLLVCIRYVPGILPLYSVNLILFLVVALFTNQLRLDAVS